MEFHVLWVRSILALWFQDLLLDRAGFLVLRCVVSLAIFVFGFRVFHAKFLFCLVFEVIQSM